VQPAQLVSRGEHPAVSAVPSQAVPLAPTPVDLEGPFAYAGTTPLPRQSSQREVVPVSSHTPAGGVTTLLDGAARLLSVDTEVLAGSVRTDLVAAQLASLVDPALRRASFEQIALDPEDGPPSDDLAASSERSLVPEDGAPARISSLPDEVTAPTDAPVIGLCRLRAHHELCTWEIFAIDRGPWLDLSAILGLLNAMLRHVRSPRRFVVLRGEDSSARVLAADERTIEAAVAEGRLELEGPDDALMRSFGDGDDGEEALEI